MWNQIVRTTIVLLTAPVFWFGPSLAQDRGTPEEAKAMAEAAAALYRSQGAEAAFEAFNNSPDFRDRDLYVFALDREGATMAHGASHTLIGRNVAGVRDPAGHRFVQDFLAVDDTGWVEYQWRNPATGNVEDKITYIINLGRHIIGVGAYLE